MANRKILITDDEEDYGMMMKNFFTTRGYDVELAFTLQDGLEKLESWKPDILFLDNNLPDGKGWDTVEEIVEKYPQLMIYLVSAYRHKWDFITSASNITVWEKPISFATLNEIFQ
jgi:DNA-binding response OmpR family regulator